MPTAEMLANDASQKITYFEDFLDDTDHSSITGTDGSGTGNATAHENLIGGSYAITTASDDGAITANASAVEFGLLNWRADSGGLKMEARIAIDDVSEAYVFVGFTDVLPSGTLEAPVFLNAADIDSDATNAVGIFFDADGTTGDQWCHGGVKADTDTTPAYTGTAVADAATYIVRIEVDSDGGVQGFVDGTPIPGGTIANAVTATTPLVPVVVVANRSANQVVADLDYVWVQMDR
jgi:hypothetical protein